MRLGVLDVGSNTVHLLVVDAHRGGHPIPAWSEKAELRLAEHLGADGALSGAGADSLVTAVSRACSGAERRGVDDLVAFATSAVRDATNSAEVLERVCDETGVMLEALSGRDEARLTFLAVRRWFGWSAGRLLVLDIGGGSLEVAAGMDEEPDIAVSLPLGAGRLTRERLPGNPPKRGAVKALREHVEGSVDAVVKDVRGVGTPDLAVATSKTFRSLARLAGAAPYSEGPRVARRITRRQLEAVIARIAGMTASELGGLPGVSPSRARQLLAGAVVAEVAMSRFDVPQVQLCPWALREGLILERLDQLDRG